MLCGTGGAERVVERFGLLELGERCEPVNPPLEEGEVDSREPMASPRLWSVPPRLTRLEVAESARLAGEVRVELEEPQPEERELLPLE
jgi:hypothetical protein